MPPELFETLTTTGTPALLMAFAIKWLHSSNSTLVNELNRERNDRLDAMEKQIANCDRDRKDLRNMLLKHLGSAVPFDSSKES